MVFDAWTKFFHGRLGREGCLFAGWLRISFALLFIADRLLLTLDIDTLLHPSKGLVPYWLGRQTQELESNMYSIFSLAPESATFLWMVHWIGILQGILLLLGVAPRFQLLGVYLNLVSFQHHNQVIWDGEDMMFKAFCINFLLMPLKNRTIFDRFGYANTTPDADESWPMWPVRLFQIEIMFIYIGASMGKFDGNAWLSGHAIYFITYSNDFYPGMFNPDFLFDRLGPLKLLTWMSLLIETSGWILVWVPQMRVPVVISMILLHLGIEVTMNMHCFEWLAITGWLVFFLQPDKTIATKKESRFSTRTMLADIFIMFFLLWGFAYQVPALSEVFPRSLEPIVQRVYRAQENIRGVLSPLLNPVGAYQGPFNMYDGGWGWQSFRFFVEIDMRDGSVEKWESPDWMNMTILERKRNMRLMNYYSTFEQGSQRLRVHLLRTLAQEVEAQVGEFSRMTLKEIVEIAPNPKTDAGWFASVRSSPLREEAYPIVSLFPRPPCKDNSARCYVHYDAHCDWHRERACPESCGLCKEDEFDHRDFRWRFHDNYEDEEADEDEEEVDGDDDEVVGEVNVPEERSSRHSANKNDEF